MKPGTPNTDSGTPSASILHYLLLSPLGSWGLGDTYRARDTQYGRTVALRLAADHAFADDEERQAFLADARAAAALSHPNIATLFDVGTYEGGCYLAYEFAAGLTLRHEMSGGAVNPRRALELAMQLADALADLHAHDLAHGDIRPETVMVTHKGSAKVLEAGMMRWTRGGRMRIGAAADFDPLGEAPGLSAYMAPEQRMGQPIDARIDVFSLGVLLYEMLAGSHPFAGAAAPLRLREPAASPALAAAVARALEFDPDVRYQSMAAFSADLRHAFAALESREGRVEPKELLPVEDDEGTGGKWWLAAAGAAAVAALAWWMLR